MVKYIMIIILFAPCLAGANSPISKTKISGIVVHDWGQDILIILPVPAQNYEGCSDNSTLVLTKNNPSFKEAYAAVLSAFNVGLSISGWVNSCRFGAPILTRVDVFD